ncbi:MAG: DsrE family protein, partial [Sphaerochaetaceae bacterium]
LYILWTNADAVTFDKMVAMYARNAKSNRWWQDVTLIIWGSTVKLAVNSELVRLRIRELLQVGVKISACKACSDSLGTSQQLLDMGIEVKYWGEDLTRILKSDDKLLTV